jgi:hypothetical protein
MIATADQINEEINLAEQIDRDSEEPIPLEIMAINMEFDQQFLEEINA